MFRETQPVTIQMGFGDELSYYWDPNVSMLDHLKEGFRWMRPNGTHTAIPGVVDNFMDVLEYLMDPLIYFDEEFTPHPAIAYQYVSGDFGETIIHDGVPTRIYRHGYYIPTDRYWSTGETLTTNDFALGLKYNPFGLDLPEYLDYEIRTTITTNDTFSILVDLNNFNTFDFYDFGGLKPIPSFIFGEGLHDFFGETSRILESDEWEIYIENPSFVGPFEMLDQNSLRIRDDYYFPTESDIENFYNGGFLETEVLTNLNFSIFAPHTQTYPLYWQDHSELTIGFIEENLTSFLSGDLDIIYQGVEGDFVTKDRFTKSFPTLLVFNLANNYLQDFKVRKAITHAIDREELQKIYPSVELSTSMLAGHAYIFEENLSTPYSMNAARVVLNGGFFHADSYIPDNSIKQDFSWILNKILLIPVFISMIVIIRVIRIRELNNLV